MSKAFVNIVLALCLCTAVNAKKQHKPWTDWTKSEVEKILNDSPWGQTQIDTDTSEMVYTPTTRSGGGDSASREAQGATNEATSVKFRIRWLSAKPVREALVGQEQLATGKISDKLKFFAEGPSYTRIVVAVTIEARDQQFSAKVLQALTRAHDGPM